MTNDKLTNDEKINLDKINYFFRSSEKVHIELLRTNAEGKNIFLNGFIIDKFSETLFIMNEDVLGKIRLSLFEIKPNGVEENRK